MHHILRDSEGKGLTAKIDLSDYHKSHSTFHISHSTGFDGGVASFAALLCHHALYGTAFHSMFHPKTLDTTAHCSIHRRKKQKQRQKEYEV
mmetsp:Transcript_25972/g.61632  ORF Transcript_25972/g.61632 Transcript_25972/m.61632 type:complete len:91 (+) Transcript_25972:507-779(+)